MNKKEEAVKRMKLWGLNPERIEKFREGNVLSGIMQPFDDFYDVKDEELERIKEFEDVHNAVVYLVIRRWTRVGELDAYFYVSDCPEEWELDKADIKMGKQVVYVFNKDIPVHSDFGSVGLVRTETGGLRIIW